MANTLLAIAVAAFGLLSALHALMNKRDPRSAVGWIAVCVFLPMVGGCVYWLLGVNRIRTKARRWQERGRFSLTVDRGYPASRGSLGSRHPEMAARMKALLKLSRRVTGNSLVSGNRVEPLFNGEQAYPAMLKAIDEAERSVALCTYLFETGEIGRTFIDALGRAAERGVDVRVLLDAIGERYSRPRASKLLRRKQGVKVARFLPLAFSFRALRVNLRNHRKLLVVDHEIAFTGGMNIGKRHMVADESNKKRTEDLHFRVTGPVALSLESTFLEDWLFTTGEELPVGGDERQREAGEAMCRAIPDGPNEDFEALQMILIGAVGIAHDRIQIMTPYFIPSRELASAMVSAALRGVEVDVILPQVNNLPYVAWATRAMLSELIERGVRVYYQPPPFDHTKLLIIDEFYINLGSANLDPRSLRLNFELNLEVYDPELARSLSEGFDQVRAQSRRITLEDLAGRSSLGKFRDSLAKLFSPYL